MLSLNELKKIAYDWAILLKNGERYYFVKALDLFYAFPVEMQKRMVRYYSEATKTDWSCEEEKLIDSMKSILRFYTGEKLAGEPTKNEFLEVFAEYIKGEMNAIR